MNRFYCVICRRVKRVQHYPDNVRNTDKKNPRNRIGACRRHNVENVRERISGKAFTDDFAYKGVISE